MTSWELMTEMAKASNQGDQTTLSNLIVKNDIEGQPAVLSLALNAFKLTKNNVSENLEAAKKLANADPNEYFRTDFRQKYLIKTIKALENNQ
jgi:hypothetical protein